MFVGSEMEYILVVLELLKGFNFGCVCVVHTAIELEKIVQFKTYIIPKKWVGIIYGQPPIYLLKWYL